MNLSILKYLPQLASLTPQQIHLVGGAVRDLLTGGKNIEDIKDIDIVMPSGSEETARVFADSIGGSFFFLDEERRITRVVKQEGGEVLQFDFANYAGPDLPADLGRRDFTVNAIALDLREFILRKTIDGLVDPFQGRSDVRNRLIRVVRPGALDDDPLRLLRAVRLAATLGFSIEDATAEHIRQRSKAVVKPASERVRDELFLILSERDAERHLLLLDSLGLLTPLLPELEPLRGFTPGMYRDHDVLTHAIKTVGYVDNVLDDLPALSPDHSAAVSDHLNGQIEQGVTRKAALRFACLVHDMAKPDTLTESDGHVRFHGHDNLGADKAVFLCRRLRLSRNTEALVTKTIKYHMRLFNLSGAGGPSRNAMYRYCRDLGDALPESLILSQADARATYEIMPKEKFSDTEKPMAQVLDYYYTKFLKARARPLVTGDDLIKMGFTPGPRFREILEQVKERQAEGLFKDRQEALDYLKTFM